MPAPLPEKITTVAEAEKWIRDLDAAGLNFHYHDDAYTIINGTGRTFTDEEAAKVNILRRQLFQFPGWDPFTYALNLGKTQWDPAIVRGVIMKNKRKYVNMSGRELEIAAEVFTDCDLAYLMFEDEDDVLAGFDDFMADSQ